MNKICILLLTYLVIVSCCDRIVINYNQTYINTGIECGNVYVAGTVNLINSSLKGSFWYFSYPGSINNASNGNFGAMMIKITGTIINITGNCLLSSNQISVIRQSNITVNDDSVLDMNRLTIVDSTIVLSGLNSKLTSIYPELVESTIVINGPSFSISSYWFNISHSHIVINMINWNIFPTNITLVKCHYQCNTKNINVTIIPSFICGKTLTTINEILIQPHICRTN